jgi:hydrogenase maturation protease
MIEAGTRRKAHGARGPEENTVLVLGIGNVLMGDEGIGVYVARRLAERGVAEGVEVLDGGVGSFLLLGPMQSAGRILLIDATLDGQTPGTIRRLTPRFSSDYPRTLTAHDIGLKDLLDAFHLLGQVPEVTLFAISVAVAEMGMELSPAVAAAVERAADLVAAELCVGA